MTPSDRDATGLLTRPDHFVQLVTPTGERRADAEFDRWVADVDADALGRLYRDMSIVRRLDTEATALQRQGELGLWPPLAGQEAAQIGSARALRDDDFVFTSYREHAVAWCRGVGPADLLTVWRGSASSGWNPYDHGMAVPQIIIGAQALHATGLGHGRGLGGLGCRERRVLRRRRHQRGRRERGPRLRRQLRRARRVLLPEQPVGDLGAGRAAVEAAARAPRRRLRHARRPRRRQRRPRRAGRDPHRARPRPPRRRPDVHRGRHLPPRPAHHGRRPEALPHRRRARRLARARPAHARARAARRRWASTPTRSSARSPTRRAAPPPSCARRSPRSPTPSR